MQVENITEMEHPRSRFHHRGINTATFFRGGSINMKKNLDIILDLDGVVFNYEAGLRRKLEAAGRTIPEGPAVHWSLAKSGWVVTEEEFFEVHNEAVRNGLYYESEVIGNASEALWKIFNMGHNIHVVTARFAGGNHTTAQIQTAKSLEKNNIPYSSISYLENKLLFHGDVYIDDSPLNVEKFLKAGRKTIMPIHKYNEHLAARQAWSAYYRQLFFPVNSWDETVSLFAEYESK